MGGEKLDIEELGAWLWWMYVCIHISGSFSHGRGRSPDGVNHVISVSVSIRGCMLVSVIVMLSD